MRLNRPLTGTIPCQQWSTGTSRSLRASALVLVLLLMSCVSPMPDMQANIQSSRALSPFDLIIKGDTKDDILAINVNSYRDPERTLSNYTRYEFEYTSKENPLLEKELFKTAEYFLERRGLKRDKGNPEILITLNFYAGRKEQYSPPKTIISTTYQSVWNTGFIGWTPVGYSSIVPITESRTEPAQTKVTFLRSIRLNFLDAAALKSGKKIEIPPLLWIGEAQIEDKKREDHDIRAYAGTLFRSLLFEFPKQSTLPPKRYYRWATFGDIGVTLYHNDWQLIRDVKQDSPADKAGLQVGDRLLEINGKLIAKSWKTYERSEYRWKNSEIFRNTDPYYNHILQNSGDREIELTIQPVGDGGLRKVRVTPFVREHGIYFIYGFDDIFDQY